MNERRYSRRRSAAGFWFLECMCGKTLILMPPDRPFRTVHLLNVRYKDDPRSPFPRELRGQCRCGLGHQIPKEHFTMPFGEEWDELPVEVLTR